MRRLPSRTRLPLATWPCAALAGTRLSASTCSDPFPSHHHRQAPSASLMLAEGQQATWGSVRPSSALLLMLRINANVQMCWAAMHLRFAGAMDMNRVQLPMKTFFEPVLSTSCSGHACAVDQSARKLQCWCSAHMLA